MATQITKAHLTRLATRATGLQKRLARFKDKASETTEKVVRTVEMGSAALGMSILQGRFTKIDPMGNPSSIEIMGVPAALGVGVALNVLGYFEAAGKHSSHLNNFGDGALASYLSNLGVGIGTGMKLKALGGALQGQITGPSKGVGDLTPGEIAAAVAASRG